VKSNTPPPGIARHRGLTLIELTVVITILLSLLSILFIGARAWKRGSDRASCVLVLRNVQVATRSYQNLYGYTFGDRPYADGGTQDIAEHLFKKGYIEVIRYQQAHGAIPCASGGTYSCDVPDVFPEAGDLYMQCSRSGADDHLMPTHGDW